MIRESVAVIALLLWLIGVAILGAVCWPCAKIADATGEIVGPIMLGSLACAIAAYEVWAS